MYEIHVFGAVPVFYSTYQRLVHVGAHSDAETDTVVDARAENLEVAHARVRTKVPLHAFGNALKNSLDRKRHSICRMHTTTFDINPMLKPILVKGLQRAQSPLLVVGPAKSFHLLRKLFMNC